MRKMRSLEQWRNIIEEQQASDLTITEFCQQHGLPKQAFMRHEVSLLLHLVVLFAQKSLNTLIPLNSNSRSFLLSVT